jgi:hypothetical protein
MASQSLSTVTTTLEPSLRVMTVAVNPQIPDVISAFAKAYTSFSEIGEAS